MTDTAIADGNPNDFADFLMARIAEDEAVARDAIEWQDDVVLPWVADQGTLEDGRGVQMAGFLGLGPDVHIARWFPGRVLAECEAKRALISAILAVPMWPDEQSAVSVEHALLLLALPYVGHPDFRQEWRK